MGPDDPCLLLIGGFPQKLLTKRTVLFIGIVSKRITGSVYSTRRWNFQFWRNTPEAARKIVAEWLEGLD